MKPSNRPEYMILHTVKGLTEPTKTVATISYKQSGSFDRLDPFILQFSQALGMSEEETDNFFKFCIKEGWNQ